MPITFPMCGVHMLLPCVCDNQLILTLCLIHRCGNQCLHMHAQHCRTVLRSQYVAIFVIAVTMPRRIRPLLNRTLFYSHVLPCVCSNLINPNTPVLYTRIAITMPRRGGGGRSRSPPRRRPSPRPAARRPAPKRASFLESSMSCDVNKTVCRVVCLFIVFTRPPT